MALPPAALEPTSLRNCAMPPVGPCGTVGNMRLIPEQAERIAQRIWSRAPSLPDRAVRVGNLRRAYQLVKLARCGGEQYQPTPAC